MGKSGSPRTGAGGRARKPRQKPKVPKRGESKKALKPGGLEVASAEDRKRFPVVMKSFEKHLKKEYLPATTDQYSRSIKRLFNADGKSFDAMASDGYLKTVQKQRKGYIFRAAATAFQTFFDKRGRGLVKGAGVSKGAGELSNKDVLQRLQRFTDHLRSEKGQWTAIQYGQALRKLYRLHKKSLDAMASTEYLDAVRKMGMDRKYPAALRAFCEFRGVDVGKRQESVSHKDGDNNAGAATKSSSKTVCKENASDILDGFLEHLNSEKGRWTAVQYGHSLRKLICLHKKSLDAMASTEYLDAVRKMGMSRKYPAALRAFCEFRGVDVGKRRESVNHKDGDNDAGTATKSSSKTGGKENASDIVEGLQPFLDHLNSEKGRWTTIQYGQSLRRLIKTHRKSLDSMASQEYLDRVRKMNWPFKYASAVRALCKFRGGVAFGHGEQVVQANAEAQKRLATARAKGRPVVEGDVLAVLRLWPFAQNTNRKNVMPKGTEWVYSSTVGLIGDRCGRTILSSATVGSEDLVKLLCKWLEDQLGVSLGSDAFPVTSININKGYAAERHRDKSNLGPSAIRALGDCRGGLLRYWPTAAPDVDVAKLRDEDAVLMDPRHSMVLFDGNRPHAVTPFEGERYSVVWFTSSRYPRATAESRAEMRRLGLRWPTANLLASAQARVEEP